MKKIIIGVTMAAALVSGRARAESNTGMENSIQAQLMAQVLNSIEKASVDLNVNDISIVKDGDKTEVQTNDVSLNGMIGFGSDWAVDLVTTKPNEKPDEQMKRLLPKLQAGAGNLNLAVDLKMNSKLATINAKFFSGYDKKTKKWLPRPLVLKVTNQLNKSLLTIRIHSLVAEKRVNPVNAKVQDIIGTCESDKVLFDFVTGENKQVPVDCRFAGTLTDGAGYKISFKYATKTPQ